MSGDQMFIRCARHGSWVGETRAHVVFVCFSFFSSDVGLTKFSSLFRLMFMKSIKHTKKQGYLHY